MRKNPRPILALDPGLRDLGYAVLAGRRLTSHGVVSLRRTPKEQRLREVRRHVRAWLRTHRPQAVVIEKTYHHPVPWLDGLHRLSLYVKRLTARRGIAFATYAPQAVRQNIAGNGKATKAEAALAVAYRLPQLRVYLTQDRRWKERYWQNMFDAVALALHHQTVPNPPSRSRRSG